MLVAMTVLADLLDLFLPATCVGCGAAGGTLCARCGAALSGVPSVVRPRPPGAPPCWAGGGYDGPLRAALLAYKERRRHGLAAPLGALLAETVHAAAGGTAGSPLWLVPVPSTRQAVRARGGDHLRGLAVAAVRALRRRGSPARVLPLLAPRGRRRDSVGLDAAARRANVAGAFRIRPGLVPPEGGVLVLVDDLVTTGATLAEAARTLAAGGAPARRAAVLAATARGPA
jgi:predicted amidophosphoribosyltransferase